MCIEEDPFSFLLLSTEGHGEKKSQPDFVRKVMSSSTSNQRGGLEALKDGSGPSSGGLLEVRLRFRKKMAKMIARSIASRRAISTSPHLCKRIKQTENEIVQMFRLPNLEEGFPVFPTNIKVLRNNCSVSVRVLDERFIRILKIFKWGPDSEKALEVLMMKVDHRLVREVMKINVEINVKIQFFKWAGKRRNFEHDSTTYMALIRCLDEAGLLGEMWNTIQDMVRSTCLIGPAELSEIIRILGKAKMVNKALSIFYQIKTHKCKPTASAYNSMILMLMQEGHHDKVHELYNEMCNEGNCFPDTVTYSALISTFGKLGREDSAMRLFDEMKENGLQPTAKIYTTMIGIYFKLGRVEKALGLFREMKEKCCAPTVFTYTELIKGLGKVGRVEEAYGVFLNMLEEGCKPDVVLINNLINVLGKAGRLADAFKLLEGMGSWQCAPSVVTYNIIIKVLFESKAPATDAFSWFEKMKENGVVPSAFTYSILIDGFCKSNRVEKALLLLEEMDEKGFPPCPAAYCSLINSLGKAKRYEAANELFQELKENCGSSSARVYAVMIKHFGKCGRLSEAVDLFNEMKKLGCNPDVYTYNALMSGMVRVGMIDEAHSLLRTMEEQGCIPDINSQNIILNGFARTGGPKRAMEMLTKMKHSKIRPDAVSYNTVLGSLSRSGMFEEAAKLMKEMNSNGLEYDLITYSSILEAVGKIDEDRANSVRGTWVLVVLESECYGYESLMKAKNLIEGRRQTALVMALLSNVGLRLVECLFEFRMCKGMSVWEGPMLISMYSLVLVMETVMNVVFYYTCKP
ncbi:hypothetical protein HHK36_025682 [Tetracentron sinense]|uniref:Pentatricopeptide repeat-containing protein n=1 Tax=Tetracentron sinense TaxID=13715 RepID=A0A835D5S9_TETSI|nr:hypothetical protein HHK36_025682 [Tetracentron sinense]